MEKNSVDLIILTKETEVFTEKKEFKKLRIRGDKKIPVFILEKDLEEYKKMEFFKSEFIGNLKKAWQTAVLHFHIAFKFIELPEKTKKEISEYVKDLLFLKNTRLFEEFSEDELRYILRISKKIEVPKARIIFYEGMEGKELYIVKEGGIKIYKKKSIKGEEKNVFLAGIHRGEFFGEMSLLREMPRTATAEAMEDSILFKISKEDLEDILNEEKEMAIKIYRAFLSGIIERLSKTNQELIDSPFTIPQEEIII